MALYFNNVTQVPICLEKQFIIGCTVKQHCCCFVNPQLSDDKILTLYFHLNDPSFSRDITCALWHAVNHRGIITNEAWVCIYNCVYTARICLNTIRRVFKHVPCHTSSLQKTKHRLLLTVFGLLYSSERLIYQWNVYWSKKY